MLRRLPRLALTLILFVATAGFRPAGLTDGETPPTVVTNAAAAVIAEPPRPAVGARAALLVDADSGQMLFEQGATEPLPPASTTKLMTALLAVESGRYFDPVTIEAADLVGGSSMGLTTGETLNLRDLLDGLLIASGNDAAYAVARHLGARVPGPGRPVARFVARMNARAAELGMRGATFRNPEGLDEPGHLMSAGRPGAAGPRRVAPAGDRPDRRHTGGDGAQQQARLRAAQHQSPARLHPRRDRRQDRHDRRGRRVPGGAGRARWAPPAVGAPRQRRPLRRDGRPD